MEKGTKIPVLDLGFVQYVDHMGSDQRVVEAARVSYQSASKGQEADMKLLSYLFNNKHTSPFEMCKITFCIKMPIFVMRQYVRHRMQNLNEVSARYTVLPDEFYLPTKFRVQDSKNKQGSVESSTIDNTACQETMRHAYEQAYRAYKDLLNLGVAKEMARCVLPVGIYTQCYSCWDMNNLLKFFRLRDDSHAQAEIQEYAKAMKAITKKLFPWIMNVYEGGLK